MEDQSGRVLFIAWSGKVVPGLLPALLDQGESTQQDETIRGIAQCIRAILPKLCAHE